MKFQLAILLAFLGFFSQGYSQTQLDSLYAVWEDNSQPHSTRVEAFQNYISKGFLFSNPDSAFLLAEKLHAYGNEKKYPKAQAIGYRIQGISWTKQGNYVKSLDYFSQCLNLNKQIDDQRGIAGALGNIGTIYMNQGDYAKAIMFFTQNIEINKGINNQRGVATSLYNIGSIYLYQDNDIKAKHYFTQNIELNKKIGNSRGIAGSLNGLGIIYKNKGDYINAQECYEKSLAINKETGNKRGISVALTNIGTIYMRQGDYSKALKYSREGLEINKQIGEKRGIANSLISMGGIYQKQLNYARALEYCKRGYEIGLSIKALTVQEEGCECIYNSYKSQENVSKALAYLEKLNSISDSLKPEETTKILQRMEFAKQTSLDSMRQLEKERLIQEKHKAEVRKKNKTRNVLIGSGLFALFVAGGLFNRIRFVRKAKKKIEQEKDRSENLLLNILPAEIAEELKKNGKAEARDYDKVSILFTDFKGFTHISETMSAQDLVANINHCFKAFDGIMKKYGIEKIKTIGDAYMAAGGLPIASEESQTNTVLAALEMQKFIDELQILKKEKDEQGFEMRAGIHTGAVVAGIVGVNKFQYDIWGDAVNTASRMESNGAVGKVNISQSTYEHIKNDPQFTFEHRGKIRAKGKGEIDMYFASLA